MTSTSQTSRGIQPDISPTCSFLVEAFDSDTEPEGSHIVPSPIDKLTAPTTLVQTITEEDMVSYFATSSPPQTVSGSPILQHLKNISSLLRYSVSSKSPYNEVLMINKTYKDKFHSEYC